MNDFENDVKRLLNEQVDARLGPRRTPPPFAVPTAADRARRRWFGADRAPWVVPLLAAACVAAVVGGSIGVSGVLADNHPAPPGNSKPAPPPHTTTEPNHLIYTTYALGGATLAVPDGWTVRSDTGDAAGQIWCLNPQANQDACTIAFRTLVQPAPGAPGGATYLDVDRKGIGIGDPPQFCGSAALRYDEQTGDRTFGGRMADWRRWSGTCPHGLMFAMEQYVVATNPAYALLAAPANAQTHAAMTEIVEYSQLPRQSDPLRLMDRGIVRSAKSGPNGVTLTIDRVVLSQTKTSDVINNNPTTYRYLVPTSVYDAAHVSVDDRVILETDGVQVLTLARESG